MALGGRLDEHRVNVNTDHVVPEPGQHSVHATQAATRIEDARPHG